MKSICAAVLVILLAGCQQPEGQGEYVPDVGNSQTDLLAIEITHSPAESLYGQGLEILARVGILSANGQFTAGIVVPPNVAALSTEQLHYEGPVPGTGFIELRGTLQAANPGNYEFRVWVEQTEPSFPSSRSAFARTLQISGSSSSATASQFVPAGLTIHSGLAADSANPHSLTATITAPKTTGGTATLNPGELSLAQGAPNSHITVGPTPTQLQYRVDNDRGLDGRYYEVQICFHPDPEVDVGLYCSSIYYGYQNGKPTAYARPEESAASGSSTPPACCQVM